MIYGIKVGPRKQSIQDLDNSHAPFCEVWFNIREKHSYNELFAELDKRNIQVGLHFWGRLDNHILANIAYPDKTVNALSLQYMKDTIDIAAAHHYAYVNIHPSHYALITIDFDTQIFEIVSPSADTNQCETLFFEHLTILNAYAKERNVLLTLETVPSRDNNGWKGTAPRLTPLNLHIPDNNLIVKAATEGFTIANDFGHTACTVRSNNRSDVKKNLINITTILASQTRLIHLGYIVPPYNGTDYHGHLDSEMFLSQDALPNQSEMVELLELFKHRQDVYVLAEPDGRHVENHHYIKQLLESKGLLSS